MNSTARTAPKRALRPAHPALPRVSAPLLRAFGAYSAWYVRRHFHAIRILKNGLPPSPKVRRPFVIYLNHASWWDPLVCLLLARQYFRDRLSFAPIDAAMLERYAFFKRLGFYGVEPGTRRGAADFLRTSCRLLKPVHHMLWLTPQGRFVDVRGRPVELQRGLGALAARMEKALFVPLAIEYAFWTEPQPEILLSFGPPVAPEHVIISETNDWTEIFASKLEATQDRLAEMSCRRNPSDWRLLDRGTSGVNGIYDAWRWMRARVSGTAFVREHGAAKGRSA